MPTSPFVKEVDEDNFKKVVLQGSQQALVLVDFWADWCQPCKILMPVLSKLAGEYQGRFILAKLDTEEHQAIAVQYGVRSLPTVMLFRDGAPIDEFAGALPEAEIRAFLARHLPGTSDDVVAQAEARLQANDPAGALDLLLNAKADDPTNPKVAVATARLQVSSGDLDAAEHSLAELPTEEQKKPEVTQLRGQLFFERVALTAGPPETAAQRLANAPDNSEARFQTAAHQVRANNIEGALENLLHIMREDRKFGDDAARQALLRLFEMLGENTLANRHRTRMFALLH